MAVFPKEEELRSNTVIAVNVPQNVDESHVRSIMRDKYNVVIAGGMGELKGKIFRIGCMGTISQSEVLATLTALGNALKELGCKVEMERGLDSARKMFQ
jgi:aspartate aminotransferase-like enzyme